MKRGGPIPIGGRAALFRTGTGGKNERLKGKEKRSLKISQGKEGD